MSGAPAVALLLVAGAVAAAAATEAPLPVERAEVVVREASVLVEPPPRRGDFGRAANFWVFEDGVARAVVRSEPVSIRHEPEGQILIWSRGEFAGAGARRRALEVLARVVEAWWRPEADVVLAVGGQPIERRRGAPVADWRQRLASMAERMQTEEASEAAAPPGAPRPEPPALPGAAALDPLLAELAAGSGGPDPRLLLLVVETRPLDPGWEASLRARLEDAGGSPDSGSPAEPRRAEAADPAIDRLAEAARLAAALGWTPVLIAARPDEDDRPLDREDDFDDWRRDVLGWEPSCVGICVRSGRSGGGFRPSWLEGQLDLDLGLWRAFVGPAAGRVVSVESELAAALAALNDRRRLWFETDTPRDGRERALAVRWAPSGQALRAPALRRSATPEGAAALALRRLLAARNLESSIDRALERRWGRSAVSLDGPGWESRASGFAGPQPGVVPRGPDGLGFESAALEPFALARTATGVRLARVDRPASPGGAGEPPAGASPATPEFLRLSCLAAGAGLTAHRVVAATALSGSQAPIDLGCPGSDAGSPLAVRLEHLATGAAGQAILGGGAGPR